MTRTFLILAFELLDKVVDEVVVKVLTNPGGYHQQWL